MITEDYVSFEIAKLLKNKGFDNDCRMVWIKENNEQQNERRMLPHAFMEGEEFVNAKDVETVLEQEPENYLEAYLCPTSQMAMKWLRENYSIDLTLVPSPNKDDTYSLIYAVVILNKKHEPMFSGGYEFEDYNQCVNDGIKYCLENLLKDE
jgi:hypothetical protein